MSKLVAVVVGALALYGCAKSAPATVSSSSIATGECPSVAGHPAATAIAEILRNPHRYNLRPVRLVGLYFSAVENSAVYPVVATGHEPSPGTGIWVSPLPASFAGKRVELIGYFTTAVKGHGDQWPGCLCIASARLAGEDAP